MDRLKSILSQILKATPNYDARMREMEIIEAWPRAVGERVAKHCWAVRMLDHGQGLLLVAAESSAWLHNLRFLEGQILDRLEQELKERRVKQLRFKLQTSEDPLR